MRYAGSRTRPTGTREPSPPFDHVSWREDEYHDATDDMAVLAEVVMGTEDDDAQAAWPPHHLLEMARYPLWVVSVRALVVAGIVAAILLCYGATRYGYFVDADGHAQVDQSALLAGMQLALLGSGAGLLVGAAWGMLVSLYVRRQVNGACRRRRE